ncbi:hypothetical protein ACOSQ3_000106 [Xanthoceras sorbifolium]
MSDDLITKRESSGFQSPIVIAKRKSNEKSKNRSWFRLKKQALRIEMINNLPGKWKNRSRTIEFSRENEPTGEGREERGNPKKKREDVEICLRWVCDDQSQKCTLTLLTEFAPISEGLL